MPLPVSLGEKATVTGSRPTGRGYPCIRYLLLFVFLSAACAGVPELVEPTSISLHNPKWNSLSYFLELEQKRKIEDLHLVYICSKKIHSEYVGESGCYGEGMAPGIFDEMLETGDKEYKSKFVVTTVDTRNEHSVAEAEYSIEWVSESPYSYNGTLKECTSTFDPEFSIVCEDVMGDSFTVDRNYATSVIASRIIQLGFYDLLE